MSERVHLFDNAKFVLILLVVIGHFADCFTYDHASTRSLFLFIYSFHMPLFIFLSDLFVKQLKPDSPLNLNAFCRSCPWALLSSSSRSLTHC